MAMIAATHQIQLKIQRAGSTVSDGKTMFHFQGVEETLDNGRLCSRRWILSMFAEQAPSRREVAELALIQVGDEVEFIVYGAIQADGFLVAATIEAVNNNTLAAQ